MADIAFLILGVALLAAFGFYARRLARLS